MWANIINILGSLAYFALDFLPTKLPAAAQDAVYVSLSSAFFLDALLFLFMWHGASAADAPSALDISAEYANVLAALIYLVGSCAMAGDVSRREALAQNDAAAVVDAGKTAAVLLIAATYLFLIEAVLYTASWAVAARAAAAASAEAGEKPPRCRGCALGDVYLLANMLNVAAAAIYAACTTANLALFNSSALFVRGAGRLVTGVAAPGIGTACIVADGLYLADALLFTGAWLRDVDDEEAAAEDDDDDDGGDGGDGGGAERGDVAVAAALPLPPRVRAGEDAQVPRAEGELTYRVWAPCSPPATGCPACL